MGLQDAKKVKEGGKERRNKGIYNADQMRAELRDKSVSFKQAVSIMFVEQRSGIIHC